MSVHKRSYQMYSGPVTPAWSRFLVLARFALLDLLEMKLIGAYLVVCFLPFVIQAGIIYVVHNPAAQAVLGFNGMMSTFIKIDGAFFLRAEAFQGFFAFILAVWVGPGLVAPDLANGALPLFLSRPLSRFEYVAGKMALLAGLLSLVTWVPNMLLFVLQAALTDDWLRANLRIGGAILAGSAIWLAVLSLIALALSATVKRRVVASLLMGGLFFFGRGIGEAWFSVLENPWGRLMNLTYVIALVWHDLFEVQAPGTVARVMLNDRRNEDLPVGAAWASLLTICIVCLWLLDRRVRAKEVVR
jgi:ABC-2 type transport system permease protein